MKTVFTNDMTAHVWAQNKQQEGRSNNGNLYFEGRTLYSYGAHYVLGYIMPDGVYLLNSTSYSPSTGKHQNHARRAVSGERYSIPDLTTLYNRVLRIDRNSIPRSAMREYVKNNVLELSERAAQYLLAVVGLTQSYDKLKRNAEKRQATEQAKDERNAMKAALAELSQFADMPDSAFTQWLDDGGDSALTEYQLGHKAKSIRSAQRAVKKAGISTTRWNKSQDRLKAIAARVDELTHWQRRTDARHDMQKAIRTMRNAAMQLSLSEAKPDKPNMASQLLRHFDALMNALTYLANPRFVYAPQSVRDKLASQIDLVRGYRNSAKAHEIAVQESAQAAKLADWQAGQGSNHLYMTKPGSGAAYIRAIGVERDSAGNITGGTLQTSKGATVPLVHAVKAFRFIKLCHDNGKAWHANGKRLRVGHFEVEYITETGNFKAACHAFEWPEIKALAESLGVYEIPATDDALEPSSRAA